MAFISSRPIPDEVTLTITTFKPHDDEWHTRSTRILQNWSELDEQVEQSRKHYADQGFAIRWRASAWGDGSVQQGEWGFDADDWREPPTVGNQVI